MTARPTARVPSLARTVCLAAIIIAGGAACGGTKDATAETPEPAVAVSAASTIPITDAAPAASTSSVATAAAITTSTVVGDSAPSQTTTPPADSVASPVPQPPPLLTPVAAPPDDGSVEPVVVAGTIEIPKIGVNESLYEGIRLTTFDRGPGHWPGTAMPGQFGNAVVGGHRTSHSRPFRHLDALVPGDEVIFTTADGRFSYKVVSTEVVTPDAMRVVNQNPGFFATLFACHPVGSTKERIIVHLILSTP